MLITVLALLFPVFNTCSTSDSEVDDHNPCWNAAPRSRPSSRPRSKPFSQGVLVILEFPRLSLPCPFSLDHNNPPSNPSPSFLFFLFLSNFFAPFFPICPSHAQTNRTATLSALHSVFVYFSWLRHLGAVPTFINSSPTPPTPPFLFFLSRKEDDATTILDLDAPTLTFPCSSLSSSCSLPLEERAHIKMPSQKAIPHYSELVEYNYAVAGQ